MSSTTARKGRRARRLAVATLVAALGLLLAGPAAVPAHAATTPTSDPADAAAGWLARQLKDGNHLVVSFGGQEFPDTGLTADGVLALDAAQTAQSAAATATAWIGTQAKDYTGASTAGESYAGPYAKLLLLADAQGENPHAFGGLDLVAGLTAREQPSGRFSDQSAFGDFSNGITQSLAILALERATAAGPSTTAVDFLAGSQCPDGSFPEQFGQATCTSSVDTTGYAVQALLAVGRTTAAGKGLDWLVAAQHADGSLVGNGTANANTTGLAAQTLRAGGRDAAAAKAVTFLLSLQNGCSAASASRGAIEYDKAKAGDAVRATTQAVPALAGTGLADVAAGGASGAPTLACVTPSPSPSPTTPRPRPSTAVEGVKTGIGSSLADTGSAGVPVVLVGIGLLVAGGALLVGTRRGRRLS